MLLNNRRINRVYKQHYWVGNKGIYGASRGNKVPFILQIRLVSHPYGFKDDYKPVGIH